MALPILDGNQTAATLSTIITGGAHIPAHTVVSLGSQAISDITSGVSGSVVSISNFPPTQTIAGAVTVGASSVTFNANIGTRPDGTRSPISIESGSNYVNARVYSPSTPDIFRSTVTIGSVTQGAFGATISGYDTVTKQVFSNCVPVRLFGDDAGSLGGAAVTVNNAITIGNSVTIGSLPAISGTVTANGGDFASAALYGAPPPTAVQIGYVNASGDFIRVEENSHFFPVKVELLGEAIEQRGDVGNATQKIAVQLYDENGDATGVSANPLPISGTVTVGNSVTIGSLPAISGTVTASPQISTVVTQSNFTSTTASTTVVSANALRKGLTVFNEGSGILYLSAGSTATTIAYQVRLSAGDYWECPVAQTALTHSAQFASSGTAGVVEVS